MQIMKFQLPKEIMWHVMENKLKFKSIMKLQVLINKNSQVIKMLIENILKLN